jgi:hypothetical protein
MRMVDSPEDAIARYFRDSCDALARAAGDPEMRRCLAAIAARRAS